jgi:hypothetical protein
MGCRGVTGYDLSIRVEHARGQAAAIMRARDQGDATTAPAAISLAPATPASRPGSRGASRCGHRSLGSSAAVLGVWA